MKTINQLTLLIPLLLVIGCTGKTDFKANVSAQNKALLSSYDDKILYVFKNNIRITKKGFYPNYEIPTHDIRKKDKRYNAKYLSKITSYLKLKRFNLKAFIADVNANSLKFYRERLLLLSKQYPTLTLKGVTLKAIRKISTKKDLLAVLGLKCTEVHNYTQQEEFILLKNNIELIECIENPSEQAQLYVLDTEPKLLGTFKHLTLKVEKKLIDKHPTLASDFKNLSKEGKHHQSVKIIQKKEEKNLKINKKTFDPNKY